MAEFESTPSSGPHVVPAPTEGQQAAPPGSTRRGFWRGKVKARVLTGVPVFLLIVSLLQWAHYGILVLMVAAASIYGTFEFLKMVQDRYDQPLPVAAMQVSAGLMSLAAALWGIDGIHGMLAAGILAALLFTIFLPAPEQRSLEATGLCVLALCCVPWFINHILVLLSGPQGRVYTVFLVLTVVFTDTLAYAGGTLMGRTSLCPGISPNKTWEGAIFGLCGGLLAGLAAWYWPGSAQPLSLSLMLVLGLLGSVCAQCSDLLVSQFKRLTHVKDSGSFLPGHGGLLDRLDSFLLTAPFFFYFLYWFGP